MGLDDPSDPDTASVSSAGTPSVLITTPELNVADPRPPSPSPDLHTYSELILRLAKALKLQAQNHPSQHSDPHYDQIDKTNTAPIQLAMMPCLMDVAKGLLDKPSTEPLGYRRVESYYKIFDTGMNFLAKQPSPNSLVIAASQPKSKGHQLLAPNNREG